MLPLPPSLLSPSRFSCLSPGEPTAFQPDNYSFVRHRPRLRHAQRRAHWYDSPSLHFSCLHSLRWDACRVRPQRSPRSPQDPADAAANCHSARAHRARSRRRVGRVTRATRRLSGSATRYRATSSTVPSSNPAPLPFSARNLQLRAACERARLRDAKRRAHRVRPQQPSRPAHDPPKAAANRRGAQARLANAQRRAGKMLHKNCRAKSLGIELHPQRRHRPRLPLSLTCVHLLLPSFLPDVSAFPAANALDVPRFAHLPDGYATTPPGARSGGLYGRSRGVRRRALRPLLARRISPLTRSPAGSRRRGSRDTCSSRTVRTT